MAFFNEFPYTRNYDSDLGWLIRNVKKLIQKFERCPTWYGKWVPEMEYPPLAFVQYGDDTYLALQDVPANTPITDEKYWMKTGATMEQIIDLQNRMNAAEQSIANLEQQVKKAYGRNFILIGDSFGVGTNGDNTGSIVPGGGWNRRFKTLMTDHCFVWHPRETEIDPTEPFGFTRNSTFLKALQQANGDPDVYNDTITDIVVLGGTNDSINIGTIEDNIALFCDYALRTFKNATIHIGVLSALKNSIKALHSAYGTCTKYGASFINTTTLLCSIKPWIGADNVHLNVTGYDMVCPYVFDAILNGNTYYSIPAIMQVTPAASYTSVRPADAIRLRIDVTPDGWEFKLYGSQNNGSVELFKNIPGTALALIADSLGVVNDVTVNFPEDEFYIARGFLCIPADTSSPIFAGSVGVAFSAQYSTLIFRALNSFTVFGGRQTHIEIPTMPTFIKFSTL